MGILPPFLRWKALKQPCSSPPRDLVFGEVADRCASRESNKKQLPLNALGIANYAAALVAAREMGYLYLVMLLPTSLVCYACLILRPLALLA